MLPDEQTSPEQIESFRQMTPERRLALTVSSLPENDSCLRSLRS